LDSTFTSDADFEIFVAKGLSEREDFLFIPAAIASFMEEDQAGNDFLFCSDAGCQLDWLDCSSVTPAPLGLCSGSPPGTDFRQEWRSLLELSLTLSSVC
jgi:hypothetical protein